MTEQDIAREERVRAAAPELLAVLMKLVDAARRSHDSLQFSIMCDGFIEEARAAIAKAEGRFDPQVALSWTERDL